MDLSYLVSDDRVDRHGKIADKRTTGGWKAAPYIIMNEVIERLAFFAILVNIAHYLVKQMHQTIPDANTHVTDWIGAAYVLTLFGAFLADAYLGRFRTIVVFSAIYAVGMVLLTISASFHTLRPQPGKEASNYQISLLYGALGLIALGTGGIKPCVSSFGADQFDEGDEKELQKKYAFFNWFFFAITMGAVLGKTLLVYIQEKVGWGVGFLIPTATTILSIIVLVAGVPHYRFQKPMGSPFTRFFQVIVASIKKHRRGVSVDNETPLYEVETTYSDIIGARKLRHTRQYRFFDKAAVITEKDTISNRWCVCTVTQVEEFKSFIKVLPVWASTIALYISAAQMTTYFLSQAKLMNRKLGNHFEIPPGSVAVFTSINGVMLVPIYEKIIIPILRKFTGHHRGITSLQRMGVGLFISIIAMTSAALVEQTRREHYPETNSMSVFWLLPQFFLIGTAEVFTYVGQLEFFYDEATDGTKSISSAVFLSEVGIGSWLSTALVKIVIAATGGQQKGWLRSDNLNYSRLDWFYWILTCLNAINFLVYLLVAKCHKGKELAARDEKMVELSQGQHTQP
ncbi:peptide transporter PTR1-like protein [Trifolium pratense]|uniref:Peptide transporter PTR1-like protein n=2 Tax=Trifolium TaxID=3898 RepID=A0A2K3NEU7_TRIPR|nr:peptide transporter PTR1-like protein [Trifolium pratense]PNY01560.1 peptide transporter PTR1-like protein [Trifolium pratense]